MQPATQAWWFAAGRLLATVLVGLVLGWMFGTVWIGLAVALAECCFGGPRLGARVVVERGMRTDALLFGESQSRMLVSVRRKHLGRLRDLARREAVPLVVVGEVRGQSLVIGDLVDVPVATARDRWHRALERRLG